MLKYRVSVLLALLSAALCAVPASGQVQRSGTAANAQLVQQYQQAVTERAQLQADNEKLKKQVDELKKDLDAAKQQLNGYRVNANRSQAALAAAETANDSNAKALADTKSKMQELIGRFRETAATLRGVETERAGLASQLAQSKAAFDQCAERNYALYQVNNEVLNRYEHQGALSYLARAEPFTRIKRTQIDNLVLEYRQRAEELRVTKPAAATTPSTPPATGPAAPTPAPAAAPAPDKP